MVSKGKAFVVFRKKRNPSLPVKKVKKAKKKEEKKKKKEKKKKEKKKKKKKKRKKEKKQRKKAKRTRTIKNEGGHLQKADAPFFLIHYPYTALFTTASKAFNAMGSLV